MENTVDVSPGGGFIFEDRDRADNSKLINVSGSISFSVVSDPQQRPIYEAAGKLFLYRNQTFEFVRTSSSYGWQIAPGGAIKTLLTFFHQSTRFPFARIFHTTLVLDVVSAIWKQKRTIHFPVIFLTP